MASEQTLRDRDTVDDTKYMEGLDITVDVCSQPEFDIIKLHKDINDVTIACRPVGGRV